jgi:hypothetical protein
MKTNSKIDKWLKWLNLLDKYIYELLWSRYIFLQLQTIIKNNQNLHDDDYFFEWICINFSKSVSVAIRLQLECKSSVITLGRLLFEIQQSPDILTLKRFESLFTDGYTQDTDKERVFYSVRQKIARREFKTFGGKVVKHVDPVIVCQDVAKLHTACSPIKQYVNKRVAHHDKKKFLAFPSYNELFISIDTIVEVYKKYTHLLRGIPYEVKIQPLWDWKDIFKVAWIKK